MPASESAQSDSPLVWGPVLPRERLLELASERATGYATADPWPHAVFDGLFPEALLDAVIGEFPTPEGIPWQLYTDEGNTRKLATSDESLMGPVTRHLLHWFNSGPVIDFLERLTGITGLVGDPHLLGGGLHQIEAGGFLNVHADFNQHPRMGLDRRLNLLLYLNHEWRDQYAGQLELWDRNMNACVKRIAPLYNRCVVFNTDDKSFHGHPVPLATPPGKTRRSVALYYYTKGRPETEQSVTHSTLYQVPGAVAGPESAPPPPPPRWRIVAARWLPPAITDAVRSSKRRRDRRR